MLFYEENDFWRGLVMNVAEGGKEELQEFRREVLDKITAAFRFEETNPLYQDMKLLTPAHGPSKLFPCASSAIARKGLRQCAMVQRQRRGVI